jgi:hypothetical protein
MPTFAADCVPSAPDLGFGSPFVDTISLTPTLSTVAHSLARLRQADKYAEGESKST